MSIREKIQNLKLEDTQSREIVKKFFHDFCTALQDRVFGTTASNGRFYLEQGFSTNYGLQSKVVVRIENPPYQDVFFRFYVPLAGFPVVLDLWDEELTACDDLDQLEDKLSNFLDNPEVLARLTGYSEIVRS